MAADDTNYYTAEDTEVNNGHQDFPGGIDFILLTI